MQVSAKVLTCNEQEDKEASKLIVPVGELCVKGIKLGRTIKNVKYYFSRMVLEYIYVHYSSEFETLS